MKVLFINNDGGGFADHIEIADGTTVEQLFQQRLPHGKPADYLVRQPGDRISITPTKIEGAVSSQPRKGIVWEPAHGSIRCMRCPVS